jgi:outer membrane lipoprotein-sorting protein
MRTIATIAILLLLVACGPTTEPGDTDLPGDAPAVQPTSDAKSELDDLFEKYEGTTYKATYDIFVNYDGTQQRSTMTQYFKGADKVRMDISAEGQEMRTYMVSDEYTTCFKQDEWQCMSLTGNDEESEVAEKVIDTEIFNETEEDVDVSILPPRTIAGKVASCFRITYTDGTSDYCLSKEGIPLYSKTTDAQGSSEMIATSVSTSVPDSDFVLPAEPRDMPAFNPGGGTFPADGEYELPEGFDEEDWAVY